MLPAEIAAYDCLDALPADTEALFADAPSIFSTRAWWETVVSHAMPAGNRPFFLVGSHDGRAAGVFPMLRDPADGDIRALTTPYTCLYAPLLTGPARARMLNAFVRYCRRFPTTRLDALDTADAAAIAESARAAGLFVAYFDHFGNWHEDVAGLGWEGYLARRPGALRETIRRRTKRVERMTGARFALFDGGKDTETGIEAFETIYARSWKEPEPFPLFNAALMRAAFAMGNGRLGVWWIDGVPAATQFWIVEHGQATVLKLAHDEAFKTHSPGTVLTAWMIRHLLEQENVTALDFGRGDDPYKKDWVATRRQRVGLLLINPWRPRGALALARHTAGRLRKGLKA